MLKTVRERICDDLEQERGFLPGRSYHFPRNAGMEILPDVIALNLMAVLAYGEDPV